VTRPACGQDHGRTTRGAASVQLIVILVPVMFGLMGFAIDLGRLYMVRGELKAAANSMAIAAAGRLIGTETSTDAASSAATLTLNDTNGFGNRYDFGGLLIGQSNGSLNSESTVPSYFSTVVDATSSSGGNGPVTGSLARHARVDVVAEAPLTFWSFLPVVAERKVSVAASAVAGMSAPLCTACGIQVIALAALNTEDIVDFGFVPATRYTLAFSCSGAPRPTGLTGAASVVPYLLLNRLDANATAFTDEQSQLFRIGAHGLAGNTTQSLACFTVNNVEQIWVNAAPAACSAAAAPSTVFSMLCGMTTRFESTPAAVCANVPEVDTMGTMYTPDTDVTDITDYTQYLGNGRRVITVAIVDALVAGGDMTVLGFRQFLIEPDQGGIDISPADRWGRFAGLYIGSVVPLGQGHIGGCQLSAGPGKVVLHQ
jgi:Flp pilus assembly protein TadG